MADINKDEIKLMESQRLDDTDQGGGQMTSNVVQDAAINNIFPDISRLDAVYGRVSIRTVFASIQTNARQTYSGAHIIMTEQASDPRVSVCFFSTKNWFDLRKDQQDRIESYLVQGPQDQMRLWGNHYKGTRVLSFLSHTDYPPPEVGDVFVIKDNVNEQFVRITEIEHELRTFFIEGSNTQYQKKTITMEIGSTLSFDFVGGAVDVSLNVSADATKIYRAVVADASKYYGVSRLAEQATEGSLQLRVNSIFTNIVPSASSESSILDYPIGNSTSPMVSPRNTGTISRAVVFAIISAGRLFLGDGVKPGTFTWTGGIPMNDDGKGNIYTGSDLIGSIHYETGTITFGGTIAYNLNGTGTATYRPAAKLNVVSNTGAIDIEINNRGFVYNFICDPIPELGSLRIDYLATGKWYTIWDQGNGQITGLNGDTSLGSGSINFNTGTASVTLAVMPDAGSKIIFYWAKPSYYLNLEVEDYDLRYKFSLEHQGIARNTFRMTWVGSGGTGPGGTHCIMDDGSGYLFTGIYSAPNWSITGPILGRLQYVDGKVDVEIPYAIAYGTALSPLTVFTFAYNYGDKFEDIFEMPPRGLDGLIDLDLTNTPILPGTFEIEWHTDLVEYDPETRVDMTKDPTYIFHDDGAGKFEGDVDDGTANWEQGTVNYTTGAVRLTPDRTSVFPFPVYKWVVTEWLHPGVVESRVFDRIDFLTAASLFPTDGTIICKYCTIDGLNNHSYTGTLIPTFKISENKDLQILPGSVRLYDGIQFVFDGGDGKLYSGMGGTTGTKVQWGTINYATREFTITWPIFIWSMELLWATGVANIEPVMSMVFRAPGAPIRPGSLTIQGTTQTGTNIIGSTDFSGDITGTGIIGHVDFSTGLGHVAFGMWVADDATAQSQDWYLGAPKNDTNQVWKPYIVQGYTIKVTCVVTSTIPLDADLIGLDPVRLPVDGRVPIFKDGFIIALQHPDQDNINTGPVLDGGENWPSPLIAEIVVNLSRTQVDGIEVYELPTSYDIAEGDLTTAKTIVEVNEFAVLQYKYDLTLGTVTFQPGFVPPVDGQDTRRLIGIRTIWEDLLLASDVQVTGHIAVTSPLSHTYPPDETTVSSVLPIGDMQSRAYNEFEQTSWTSVWSDILIGVKPLASYNFVDYPITVVNISCTKERWMVQFTSSTAIRVVGENLGVLAENVTVISGSAPPVGLPDWDGISVGAFTYLGVPCLVCGNRQFPGFPFWVLRLHGFGLGWASGNLIRFNSDAANFPLTFIRTTLQGPAGLDPNDHYTVQVRGDNS